MQDDILAILEGMLFVTGDEGITLQQFSDALEMDINEVEEALNKLKEKYENDTRSGIELACYSNKYKLVTKAICHEYCQRLLEENKVNYFSQAALETLAIIAYKQPITRVEIEEIRGVGCDAMIRKLLAKGLIREGERLETPGMPFTYYVTDYFMDTFKLKSLEELPKIDETKLDLPEEQ